MHKFNPFSFFYGWWILAACFTINLLTGGIIAMGFTAYFEPIFADFGWSYTIISLAASFRGVEAGLLAPLVGIIVDRWGPRRLALGGLILICLSMVLLSRINSLTMFYVAFAIIALGGSGCSPTVLMTTVVHWFRKRTGLAIGVMTSGFACGGVLVPVIVKLIDSSGWRMALIIQAIIIAVVGIPFAMVLRHKPEQYGYLPDGEKNFIPAPDVAALPPVTVAAKPADFSARQAMRSRLFWHLTLALMAQFLVIGTVVAHVMPFLSSVGISRTTASLVTMALPLASIFGRIGSGWLGDRFDKKLVFTVLFGGMAVGMLCMSLASSKAIWLVVPYIILVGIGWGGNATIRVAITSETFGRSSFGSILGVMLGLSAVGSVIGPVFGGWIYDTLGSYQVAWWIYTGILLIATITVATLPIKSAPALPAAKP